MIFHKCVLINSSLCDKIQGINTQTCTYNYYEMDKMRSSNPKRKSHGLNINIEIKMKQKQTNYKDTFNSLLSFPKASESSLLDP